MKMNNETTITRNGELVYTIDEKSEKPIKFNHNANKMSDALGISEKTVKKYQRQGFELMKALISKNDRPSITIENIYKVIHNESDIGTSIMIERVMICIIDGVLEKVKGHQSKLISKLISADLKGEA